MKLKLTLIGLLAGAMTFGQSNQAPYLKTIVNTTSDSINLSANAVDVDGVVSKYEWSVVSTPIIQTPGTTSVKPQRAKPGGKSYILKPDSQGYLNIVGSTYMPGDTLYLSGIYKSVSISNLSGAEGNYITITNLPGKTAVLGDSLWSGGAWAQGMLFRNCHYIEIYGSTKDHLKLIGSMSTKLDPNGYPVRGAFFNMCISEISDNFAIHDLTIRRGGTGIWAKTEVSSTNTKTWYPNSYMENLEIYNVDIFDTQNEAMYIGHTGTYWNIQTNQPYYESSPNPTIHKQPIKWRNVSIHDNYLHEVRNDGIQTAAVDGLKVYNNEVTSWGLNKDPNHNGGILIGGRVKGFLVRDNFVHDGWGEMLQIFAEGPDSATVINNLFARNQGEGVSMRGTNNLVVNFSNNTVAYTGGNNVRINGYFGAKEQNILKKNLLIQPRMNGGTVYANAYIYLENSGAALDSDNKKFPVGATAQLDAFYKPLPLSPALGYGYTKPIEPEIPSNPEPVKVIIVAPNSATTTIKGLAPGFYVFRVIVTDDKGATSVQDVNVQKL